VPSVVVPPPYRGPTQGQERIQVEGSTVGECLRAVGERFPGFSEQIFDPAGKVHRFVDLFINGDQIERTDLESPLGADDRLEILAAIAGG
jgi:molybdopterin synthase sulfur carrier subunit